MSLSNEIHSPGLQQYRKQDCAVFNSQVLIRTESTGLSGAKCLILPMTCGHRPDCSRVIPFYHVALTIGAHGERCLTSNVSRCAVLLSNLQPSKIGGCCLVLRRQCSSENIYLTVVLFLPLDTVMFFPQ